ncbi:MAG: DUF1573 domain-containing protein, partial [Planctomycetes bacterium]|nr:DUF1573 domain-containing protein [Planctomycetota bacterium]
MKPASCLVLGLFVASIGSGMAWAAEGAASVQPGPSQVVPSVRAVQTRPAPVRAVPPRGLAQTQPAQTQPAGPPPKFRCDELVYNFGTVWASEKVEHAFILHNDGEGVMTIEARGTCGCTATEYDKTIAPGGQGKVKAVLTTGNYTVPMNKIIVVTTNDLAQKTVNLTLSGNVKQRVTTDPVNFAAYFGMYSPGMELTKTFKLTNNTEKPMKIEVVANTPATQPGVVSTAPAAGPWGAQATSSCFKVAVKEIDPGKVAELTVTAEPPFKDDANSAQFTVRTAVEGMADLMLPCSIMKPPTLQVTPSVVRLPPVPLASPWGMAIEVRNNGDDPINLQSVECSDRRIKVEAKEVEDTAGKVHKISIEVPKDFSPESSKPTMVTIKTDYQKRPSIDVPLIALAQPRTASTQPAVVTAESLVGRPAPAMTLPSPEGQQIRIGGSAAPVTVVSFWATWCSQSRRQIPRLDQLYQTYRRRGVEFVNVCVDEFRPTAEISEVVRALDSKIPVGLDPSHSAAKAYGVSQFPMLFVIGKGGNVEAVRRGIGREANDLEAMVEVLAEQIDKLLEGKTRVDFTPRPIVMGIPCGLQAIPVPPAGQVGPAMLQLESMRQDAGLFKPKTQGQYKVYLRNAGGSPLEIKNVVTPAGLTVDPSYPKTVSPGATGFLVCTFETPAEPKPFEHLVMLESSDPIRPRMGVTVLGQSKPYIEVQPVTGVDFSSRVRTFSVPRIATLIYNGPAEKIEYKTPTSSSPKFEAEIRPTRQPHVAIITVKAKPPFDLGETKATISIETDQPEQPVVEV